MVYHRQTTLSILNNVTLGCTSTEELLNVVLAFKRLDTECLDRKDRKLALVCQSTFHLDRDCPHNREQVNLSEESDIDKFEEYCIHMYTKDSPTEAEIFMMECLVKLLSTWPAHGCCVNCVG